MVDKDGKKDLYRLTELIENGNSKERGQALNDLRDIFGQMRKEVKIDSLTDKSYHRILESLFKCAVIEKQALSAAKSKATILSRLKLCAEILRTVTKKAGRILRPKTVEAFVKHICQTVVEPDGSYFEPLKTDYIKALSSVLEHQNAVETLDCAVWVDAVDFCLQVIDLYLDATDEVPGGSAGSISVHGSSRRSMSLARSTSRSGPTSKVVVAKQDAEDLLQVLHSLVISPNAPNKERYIQVAGSTMRFLQLLGISVGPLHHVAFSIINAVTRYSRLDHCSFSQALACKAIPIICRIWRGKSLTRDPMLNSVRDEILILLLSLHLHLERCVRDAQDNDTISDLEDLTDAFRADYTKRSREDMLLIDHLNMSELDEETSKICPFRLYGFNLMLHNNRGEREWAILQTIGILERLLSIASLSGASDENYQNEMEIHPRKRQRLSRKSNRTLDPLKNENEQVRTAGLHWLPFVLEEWQLTLSELEDFLEQLLKCTTDKRFNIASSALLALTSCTNQDAAREISLAEWMQIWHVGRRALTFSITCRAAALLLHSLIAQKLVQYKDIGADIDSIISTFDTSGPIVLCDSSITLMSHLLHMRVTEVPGASLVASQQVIRWLFSRWNPVDRQFAAHHAIHVKPHQITGLLRICMGYSRLSSRTPSLVPCESVAQAWQHHLNTQDVLRYLLLLPTPTDRIVPKIYSSCPPKSTSSIGSSHTSSFYASRKLILELTHPKCADVLKTWEALLLDRTGAISTDTFRSGVSSCITMSLLVPYLSDANETQVRIVEDGIIDLSKKLLQFLDDADLRDSKEATKLNETLLQSLQPYLPACNSSDLRLTFGTRRSFLKFVVAVADNFSRRNLLPRNMCSQGVFDEMDLQQDLHTHKDKFKNQRQQTALPRRELALDMWSGTFYRVAIARVALTAAVFDAFNPGLEGHVPPKFTDYLLGLGMEEFLSSRQILKEMLTSDLILQEAETGRIFKHVIQLVSSNEFGLCEIALLTSLDVMQCLWRSWSDGNSRPLSEDALEFYEWNISIALERDRASPEVQRSIADLLLLLLRENQDYGVNSNLKSPRSNLLSLLATGNVSVRFYIASHLAEIFSIFLLKSHDDVFVDVQAVLPASVDWLEGIYFRLYVFAKLASRWPNLLRRCIYHIFETAGRLPASVEHSSRCLDNISSDLLVESPKRLFALFAPQILYTWLEEETINSIPFAIFRFGTLLELLEDAQEETVALLVMRGQDEAVHNLALLFGLSVAELIQKSFTKVMAYSVAHDISRPPKSSAEKHVTGEVRVRKILGQDLFYENIHFHFADMMVVLFNLMGSEGDIEKYFARSEELKYAAKTMDTIKALSSSDTNLPPNQQPHFKVKFLTAQIDHLCSRTQYDHGSLYTPALVVAIARKLLNTIHPALGSLHACSVIRKLRVLVALAGKTAISGYPLEMILQSIRPYITDADCAEDTIGILQYLMGHGLIHLQQTPSFVAGLGLATLGSLKVCLESQKASTTQESQHRTTKTKAEQFHVWFGQYMLQYESPLLLGQTKSRFKTMMDSAFNVRSVGNADNMTPESQLLMQLLEDNSTEQPLLNRPARELAVRMLATDFKGPESFRDDVLGDDELSILHAGAVWRSSRTSDNNSYLSWAARVLGRAFASSGHVHQEFLRESRLFQEKDLPVLSSQAADSRTRILMLLQELTMGHEHRTIGLAEAALRNIITYSAESKVLVSQGFISDALQTASMWPPYNIPPSEILEQIRAPELPEQIFRGDAIFQEHWLRDLSVTVAESVPSDIILGALVPLLREVAGFADRAFPFILHLALSTSPADQGVNKKQISRAFVDWFANEGVVEKENLKMLLNSLLYLRTQAFPGERSSADRAQWLDIDYLKASVAASHCGMFKTSLLFVEEFCSLPVRSSRRSSAIKDTKEQADIPTEILLAIFENVDDPDMYYGVQQKASLDTILARFEYEKDGSKTLAFRGARYDSHIRRHDPEASGDVQCLVKAFDVLNLNGLSNSFLQAQQTVEMSPETLESLFYTARKLEQWDIPVPSTCASDAVTIYKAYQALDTAESKSSVLQAVNEGLQYTMKFLAREDLSANALHGSLQTLAVLVEMDEIVSSAGSGQFEEMLVRFQHRSSWMKIGRFEDVNQIISCRGTTLSTMSQQPRLRELLNVKSIDTRLVEVHMALEASKINRAHNASQESLSLATAMIDLIGPCNQVGINPEIAVQFEVANSLWEQGEMTSSIGMLQGILDDFKSPKPQTIVVGRSELLSRTGYQVSVARLEKADKIIDKFLKPALTYLKGRTTGEEAGQVFHQFAIFCDQQLQDPDSMEDLERLKKLQTNKANEVDEYENLILRAQSSAEKTRYKALQSKAKTWLKLDDEELQRHSRSRDEFLRQCLENYLLALAASDDHDSNALRFAALWLENSEEDLANVAVAKQLTGVPSRKFAQLMNQLSSRLQDTKTGFQKLLFHLVCRICIEHPLHGMYQMYAGMKSRINEKDESAVSRRAATEKVVRNFDGNPAIKNFWMAVARTNKCYCILAGEKDDQKYKSGRKILVRDSKAADSLSRSLVSYQLPPPTMSVALRADMDYTGLPIMVKLEPQFSIASGVSAPKIITLLASNGARYKQLVKGGNDDLRQDAIMEQVFEQVSALLKTDRSTRQRNLSIRTYKVLPLTNAAGVIEFVADTIPLHEYLMPAHERYYPKDLRPNQCRTEIGNVSTKSVETRIQKFRHVSERFHPVMRYFFTEKFTDPDEWFVRRLAYSRSTAAISILGHVLGLGDRHGHNILLDSKSGEVVHIDLGVAFEMGRVLPVPELVPFRLTRDIVDGMGITKTEGVFRRCCEFTLEALRKEVYTIMTILDVLRYDPLYSWSISPIRLARLQEGQSVAAALDAEAGHANEKTKEAVNEPGEADRALTVVNKKLSKTLSVTATVNDLINQASDERNLAVLYSGWAAYA